MSEKYPFIKVYDYFVKRNSLAIQELYKQFNIKKAAIEFRNERHHKTGILNPNKMHMYLIDEDIFLSRTKTDDGESHGFLTVVDWSSSMNDYSKNHINMLLQGVITYEFCKKAKLPFEMYTYTYCGRLTLKTEKLPDDYNYEANRKLKKQYGSFIQTRNLDILKVLSTEFKGDQLLDIKNKLGIKLLELIDSKPTAYDRDGILLLRELKSKASENRNRNLLHYMGGTPTVTTFILLEKVIRDFKRKHSLQKINIMHITDGYSSGLDFDKNYREGGEWHTTKVFVDPYENRTKKPIFLGMVEERLEIKPYDRTKTDKIQMIPCEYSVMGSILDYYKRTYGVKVIGYYLYSDVGHVSMGVSKASSGASAFSDSMKNYVNSHKVPNLPGTFVFNDYHGHDQMIFMKGARVENNDITKYTEEKYNDDSVMTTQKMMSISRNTIRKDNNSRFLAKKVMEIFG